MTMTRTGYSVTVNGAARYWYETTKARGEKATLAAAERTADWLRRDGIREIAVVPSARPEGFA